MTSGASGDGTAPVSAYLYSTSAPGVWTDDAIFAQLLFGNADASGTGGAGVKAKIAAYVDDIYNFDTGLSFYTSTDGATIVEGMRLTHDSKLIIGGTIATSPLQVVDLPVYANNAAALAGGLTAGAFYQDGGASGWTFRTTQMASTSWDGDSFSTTAKTLIDLSSVFGVPAGVNAVLVRTLVRDAGSVGNINVFLALSPNDIAISGPHWNRPAGLPNDYWSEALGICPCDINGDIYYQIDASGTDTMDVYMEIWGYYRV